LEDSCEHGNEPSGSIKYSLAAQLAASQEGLSYMKLVNNDNNNNNNNN
jgi:putative ribosome biogenesis GTPase RsgA